MTRLALITGGQQGIGFGIALELINQGWQVAIASLPESNDSAVISALETLGGNAHYYQYDLNDISRINALLDHVESQQGTITTLINNAGVTARERGDMLDISSDDFDFTMDINLRGTFFLSQALCKRMLKTDRSIDDYQCIVFITSVSAEMVSIERAEYCISKASASMAAQLFATRMAEHDIGVFELRPGIIETDMTAAVKDSYTPRIENGLVPAKRWGQPSDIGSIVLPLVSGQMRYACGAKIPVDGGLLIHRL